MPSPESSRGNLENARMQGKVIFWRSRSESQRVKAEIAWLHHTKPDLSQRVIARTLHVSQPYVARLLKRLLLSSGMEKALGADAYEHYRRLLEKQRREHFLAVGGPPSLTVLSNPESPRALEEPQPAEPISSVAPAAAKVKAEENAGIEYVELGRSTSGEIIEIHGSRPGTSPPRPYAPTSRLLSTREIAQMMRTGELFVADQLGGLRFRR